jgi:hypothetical protein
MFLWEKISQPALVWQSQESRLDYINMSLAQRGSDHEILSIEVPIRSFTFKNDRFIRAVPMSRMCRPNTTLLLYSVTRLSLFQMFAYLVLSLIPLYIYPCTLLRLQTINSLSNATQTIYTRASPYIRLISNIWCKRRPIPHPCTEEFCSSRKSYTLKLNNLCPGIITIAF